jgi:ankyrin repeat protein
MSRSIFSACLHGDENQLLTLIQRGANVNTPNDFGFTPLCMACHLDNSNCVEILVSAGADVNKSSGSGLTPLHYAAGGSIKDGESERSSKCVEILIASGSELNKKDEIGEVTPLHIAAYANLGIIMKVLLEHGADPSIRNNEQHLFWEEIRDVSLKNEMREFLLSWEFPMKEPAE